MSVLAIIGRVVGGLFGIGVSAYGAASALTFTHQSVRELAQAAQRPSTTTKTAIGQ